MAPHSSTLAWQIPWTEELGRLQSMGSLRVGQDSATSLSRIGEGNGNPLQCSFLENPRDGGAWWAAVYGVPQSRTRLKRLSSSSSKTLYSHTRNRTKRKFPIPNGLSPFLSDCLTVKLMLCYIWPSSVFCFFSCLNGIFIWPTGYTLSNESVSTVMMFNNRGDVKRFLFRPDGTATLETHLRYRFYYLLFRI